ncbi:MAG TPA: hypothetical protein VJP05_01360 [Acidimicrobiia bacterium]|nr:hypothetical protein [Acidimicrobiia bacterium]
MYEFADWGHPAAPDWTEPRERLDARLPVHLVRVLRSRARAEGISMSVLVHRLISEAMDLPATTGPGRPAGYWFD